LTTILYAGRFFAPIRINLIANKSVPPSECQMSDVCD